MVPPPIYMSVVYPSDDIPNSHPEGRVSRHGSHYVFASTSEALVISQTGRVHLEVCHER